MNRFEKLAQAVLLAVVALGIAGCSAPEPEQTYEEWHDCAIAVGEQYIKDHADELDGDPDTDEDAMVDAATAAALDECGPVPE